MFVHLTHTDLSSGPVAQTMAVKMLPQAEQAPSRHGSKCTDRGLTARAHTPTDVGEMQEGMAFEGVPVYLL